MEAQKLLDLKVSELKKYIDTIKVKFEELNSIEDINEKLEEKSVSEEEIELLYDTTLLNNVIQNKLISIIEFIKTVTELGMELDTKEYLSIPNVVQYQPIYQTFVEKQRFFYLDGDNVVRNEELKRENFEKFKKEFIKTEAS